MYMKNVKIAPDCKWLNNTEIYFYLHKISNTKANVFLDEKKNNDPLGYVENVQA